MKSTYLIIAFVISIQVNGFSQQLQTRMNVFFNQDYYVPGDTAFFSVKLLSDKKGAWNGKQLLHLEVISQQNTILLDQYLRLTDGSGSSHILFSPEFKPEIYLLRIHAISRGKSVLEWRNFFSLSGIETIRPKNNNEYPVQNNSTSIEVSGLAEHYPARNKVVAKIRVKKGDSPLSGKISVRVVNKKAISEENPLGSFSESIRIDKSEMVNSIVWKGKLVNTKNSSPVPDSAHLLIYLQKNLIGYDLYTKNGEFDFPVFYDFYDDDILFFSAEHKGKELDDIEMSFYKEQISDISFHGVSINSAKNWYSDYKAKKRKVEKSYQALEPPVKIDAKEPRWVEDDYMEPDVDINLANYLIFPTMEELIREIIPILKVRKNKDQFELRLYLQQSLESGFMSSTNPLIIIDGMMTKDVNYLFQLKPADVAAIKIVRKLSKLKSIGELGKNGVVFVITKKNSSWQTLSSRYPHVVGVRSKLDFKNFSSEGQNGRIPYFRECLYWDSEIMLNEKGETTISFDTPDDEGQFILQIDGISSEGDFIRSERNFNTSRRD